MLRRRSGRFALMDPACSSIAGNVIGEAGEGLDPGDGAHSVADLLHHFRGQEPSLSRMPG